MLHVGMAPVGVDHARRCAAHMHSPAALHQLVPAGSPLLALDSDLSLNGPALGRYSLA